MNDPSGDVMYFNVTLGAVRGGAKMGAASRAQILIDHVKGSCSFERRYEGMQFFSFSVHYTHLLVLPVCK